MAGLQTGLRSLEAGKVYYILAKIKNRRFGAPLSLSLSRECQIELDFLPIKNKPVSPLCTNIHAKTRQNIECGGADDANVNAILCFPCVQL